MTGLQLEIRELTPYKAGTRIQQEIGFDLAASTYRITQLRRRLEENIYKPHLTLVSKLLSHTRKYRGGLEQPRRCVLTDTHIC